MFSCSLKPLEGPLLCRRECRSSEINSIIFIYNNYFLVRTICDVFGLSHKVKVHILDKMIFDKIVDRLLRNCTGCHKNRHVIGNFKEKLIFIYSFHNKLTIYHNVQYVYADQFKHHITVYVNEQN